MPLEKIDEEESKNKNDKRSGQAALENVTNVDIVGQATSRKEDVPIDVNKRQADENEDVTNKLVGLYL